MGEEIIDELMGALKFNKSLTDGRHGSPLDGVTPALAIVEDSEDSEDGAACCRPAMAGASATPTTTRA